MRTQREVIETAITIDRGDATAALARTTASVAQMLRTAASGDRAIPHLEWTIAQCAAHLIISNHLYAHQVAGGEARVRIEDTAAVNAWSVVPAAGMNPAAFADDLESSTARFIEVVRGLGHDARFRWWSGSDASVDTAVALLLSERLVHGWDIACAYRAPWTIERQDAALGMAASLDVMPLLVDREAAAGFDATVEIRLRGADRYSLRFSDGVLVTSKLHGRVGADVRISADPVAMMLVGYGRIGQSGQIMRARMVAWGRRPAAALRLRKLLRNP